MRPPFYIRTMELVSSSKGPEVVITLYWWSRPFLLAHAWMARLFQEVTK